jgi:hypothetical protein
MTTERAERFQQLCEEAATKLNTTPDSERSRHIATLRMMHEQCTIRLIEGLPVDPAHLLKLSEAVEAFLPQVESAKVTIEVVDGVLHCPRCNYSGEGLKPLPIAPVIPRTIDLEPSSPPTATHVAVEPKPEPAKPDFHPTQDFGPPSDLRPSHGESWRSHVRGNGNGLPDYPQYINGGK